MSLIFYIFEKRKKAIEVIEYLKNKRKELAFKGITISFS
jgi:hypothetical protein